MRDLRVGDWVVRLPEGDCAQWPAGEIRRVDELEGEGFFAVGSNQWWMARYVEVVDTFDPHALAMALQLAAILYRTGRVGDPQDLSLPDHAVTCPEGCHQCTADWLVAEVQKELESQL